MSERHHKLTLTTAEFKSVIVDGTDADKRTILHWMVRHRDEECVAYLIEHKAAVNKADYEGWTPLHIAAFQGHLAIARLLLLAGADSEAKTTRDHTEDDLTYPATSTARDIAELGDFPVVVELLNVYAQHKASDGEVRKTALYALTDVPRSTPYTPTDLESAVLCGDLEKAEAYLKADGNPNAKINDDMPLLVYAAKHADQSMCELLCRYGADINTPDSKGYTPIYWAIKSKVYPFFRFFFDKKAILELNNAEGSLIHATVEIQNDKILELLLQAGVNPNVENNKGENPLRASTISARKILIKYGINLNHANKAGDTLLHICAANNSSVTHDLLKAGADLTIKNKDKLTPLQVAFNKQSEAVIKVIQYYQAGVKGNLASILDHFNPNTDLITAAKQNQFEQLQKALSAQANRNYADEKDKWTALHWAARHGSAEMVRALLQEEADINAKNNDGWTPLYLAIYNQHLEIIELLLAAKADILISTTNFYQEEGKPYCRSFSRGLHIAQTINNAALYQRLQAYAYQQCMQGKEETPDNKLIAAVRSYNLELAKKCLEQGASSNLWDGNWALIHYAIESEHCREWVKLLQQYGADIFVEEKEFGSNLLDLICRRTTNPETVKYVHSLGFAINRQRPTGLPTPLLGACFFTSRNVIAYLCEQGADVNLANDSGDTPLLKAAETKYIKPEEATAITDYLLTHTKADSHAKNYRGENAVYKATLAGNITILEPLLKRGIAFDEANINGWTPLMAACSENYHTLVKRLLEASANVNKRTKDDWSVLGIAISNNATESVKLLLAAGAEVNKLFAKGHWSPLQLAASEGNKEIVALLLKQPTIDVNVRNKKEGEAEIREGRRTPLIAAAIKGHAKICEVLLKAGAEPSLYDSEGYSALKAAAKCGYLETVNILLQSKYLNPNARINDTRFMDSPLNAACQNQHPHIVKRLLAHPKIDVNQNDFFCGTPLTSTVHAGNIEIVRLLLAVPTIDLNRIDTDGNNALMIARQKGFQDIETLLRNKMADMALASDYPLIDAALKDDKEQVEKLLAKARVNINKTNAVHETALYAATKMGHSSVVARLLTAEDIDPNLPNEMKMPPLYIAATLGYVDIVKLLLQHPKIEVNKKGPMYQTPLMQATEMGRAEVTALLLAHESIDPNLGRPHIGNDGCNPVCYAVEVAYRGLSAEYNFYEGNPFATARSVLAHPKVNINIRKVLWGSHGFPLFDARCRAEHVRLVLQHSDVNLNLVSKNGYTALCAAAADGLTETVYMLLSRLGINVNHPNKDGSTPLQYAAGNGHTDCVAALLKAKGVLVNKASHLGKTPLFSAAANGYLDIVKRLITAPGIDLNKANKEGETPLIAAAAAGREEVVKTLVEAGADLSLVAKSGLDPRMTAYAKGYPKLGAYLKEAEDKRALAQAAQAQTLLKEEIAQKAEKKALLKRQATVIHLSKEQLLELDAQLKALEEDEAQLKQTYALRQWSTEAQQYLLDKPHLSRFYYHVLGKITELLVSYQALSALDKNELDKATRSLVLLGKPYNLPFTKEVAQNFLKIPVTIKEKDKPKFQAILNLLSDYQTLAEAVQTASRLLSFRYESQVALLQDENQIQQLAECAVLRFLDDLVSGKLPNQRSLFEQLHHALVEFKAKESVLKVSECKFKVVSNKVLTDRGIFQEPGIRYLDGRCFAGKATKLAIYGYRLGDEGDVNAQQLALQAVRQAPHSLKDNPFIVPEEANSSAKLVGRFGLLVAKAKPKVREEKRLIDMHRVRNEM